MTTVESMAAGESLSNSDITRCPSGFIKALALFRAAILLENLCMLKGAKTMSKDAFSSMVGVFAPGKKVQSDASSVTTSIISFELSRAHNEVEAASAAMSFMTSSAEADDFVERIWDSGFNFFDPSISEIGASPLMIRMRRLTVSRSALTEVVSWLLAIQASHVVLSSSNSAGKF